MVDNFLRYLEAERKYSRLTVRAYGDDIRQFLLYYGVTESSFHPEEVTGQDIRSFVMSLSEQKIAPSSINRKISSIRALFRYLIRQGVVESNPTLKVRSLKVAQRVVNVATSEQMSLLTSEIIEIKGDFAWERDTLILLLFYATGVRLAELIGIEVDDISPDMSEIKIHGKGDKERIVVITSVLQKKLSNYLKIRQEICSFDEKSLLLSNRNVAISRSYVYKLVRETLRDLGLNGKCSPHVLRHTFATHLLNGGAGVEMVKSLLGHSSLRSTQIYTHSSIAKLVESYKGAHPWAKGEK